MKKSKVTYENLDGVKELNDSEMKLVEVKTNDCPRGTNDEECFSACVIELPEGKITGGVCYYSGIGSICACVETKKN